MSIPIPAIYILSHYMLGIIAYFQRWIIIIPFLLYQIVQFVFDVRFYFLNKNCYLQNNGCYVMGNSFHHTMIKISQFLIGYMIMDILFQIVT